MKKTNFWGKGILSVKKNWSFLISLGMTNNKGQPIGVDEVFWHTLRKRDNLFLVSKKSLEPKFSVNKGYTHAEKRLRPKFSHITAYGGPRVIFLLGSIRNIGIFSASFKIISVTPKRSLEADISKKAIIPVMEAFGLDYLVLTSMTNFR